ncbi:heterodisulfide reductase-related iron-sulfur binding cluster [Engelhardtia mirabilis]|uniref:Anaerobic glycerol-3-phosphate dehydrogenase subunit C n=1 Tax=Engelhardtia mirabilis TaxID=2528011 RepID=A0A518BMW6_9BACT|nr:Anaerobic glycerol-3-phosphate dehydrogenase subunit C [Planctomycetes bacterium Pla133]QDV02641.1 Anaerobic glycerol-3-phosphate dehydrogenase subunit C [Planctomycetes bacterium Pla86]
MTAKNGIISYQPTDGLSYDPADEVYWDESALQKEVTRAFEICHGCRMCFKYCDSFPRLFDLIDEKHDGDTTKLDVAETDAVIDDCFQCKLCEVQCPYTPRDSHEFQLDFPKLVHRWKAVHRERRGTGLREKVLGDPDTAGKLARASFGMANVANRNGLHRWFLEKVLGIHRDKLLPDFAGSTFEKWATQEGLMATGPATEAVLFQTCYVQNNEPQIGRDTVEVMQRNQVDLVCEKGLECCGMPAWESGDLETLRKRAAHNIERLSPHVEAGAKVLAINPTCSMMMRREYPELVEPELRDKAKALAAAVMDPSEYLWSIRKEERFDEDFKSTPGNAEGEPKAKVAYHAPCHLRAQAVGFRGRDLLRKLPGVQPELVMECCGHDGTYAMTVEGFEPSARIGKKAFDGMAEAGAEIWVTDCPLAAIQFQQHAGVKAMHPMSVLARAYRGDAFRKSPTADQ